MSAMADPREALSESATALRRLAAYRLPDELDRRILVLSERKDEVTADERAELLAWVQFTQQRSIEKFGAEAALRNLTKAFPDLASSSLASSS